MKEVENGALAVRSRKLGDLTMRTIEVKLEGQRSKIL